MLAVILASADTRRLYTGLSLLVSTAAAGEPARGLVTFGALPVLCADEGPVPRADMPGSATFLRTFAELRSTARELDDVRLWACSAAASTVGVPAAAIERHLDGICSTPRFLEETAGARLVAL